MQRFHAAAQHNPSRQTARPAIGGPKSEVFVCRLPHDGYWLVTNTMIYAAYQTAVRRRGVTADQLHATNCNGQQLSALMACSPPEANGIPIHIGWDDLEDLEDAEGLASAPTG